MFITSATFGVGSLLFLVVGKITQKVSSDFMKFGECLNYEPERSFLNFERDLERILSKCHIYEISQLSGKFDGCLLYTSDAADE